MSCQDDRRARGASPRRTRAKSRRARTAHRTNFEIWILRSFEGRRPAAGNAGSAPRADQGVPHPEPDLVGGIERETELDLARRVVEPAGEQVARGLHAVVARARADALDVAFAQ